MLPIPTPKKGWLSTNSNLHELGFATGIGSSISRSICRTSTPDVPILDLINGNAIEMKNNKKSSFTPPPKYDDSLFPLFSNYDSNAKSHKDISKSNAKSQKIISNITNIACPSHYFSNIIEVDPKEEEMTRLDNTNPDFRKSSFCKGKKDKEIENSSRGLKPISPNYQKIQNNVDLFSNFDQTFNQYPKNPFTDAIGKSYSLEKPCRTFWDQIIEFLSISNKRRTDYLAQKSLDQ
jgi:hypothetical protein